jgi:hypothetical protein
MLVNTALASSVSQCAVCEATMLSLPAFGRVFETQLALQRVVGAGVAFDDDDLGPRPQCLGQFIARELGAAAVVRPHEGEVEAGLLQRGRVQRHVEVHDRDAGLQGPRDGRHHGARIRRRNDDHVVLLGDEVFDSGGLRVEVGFRLHAHGLQLEVAAFLLVGQSPFGHVLEELIGQGLHDQPDPRLGRLSLGSGDQQCKGSGHGGSAASEVDSHVRCLLLAWIEVTGERPKCRHRCRVKVCVNVYVNKPD